MSTTSTFVLGLGCGAAVWYLTKDKQPRIGTKPVGAAPPVSTKSRDRRGARR